MNRQERLEKRRRERRERREDRQELIRLAFEEYEEGDDTESVREALIERIDAEWDRDEGFFGRLRRGRRPAH